jgi:CO/xanthine dehydrogenase Mo-binding subunit
MLWGHTLRSPHAHARIVGIDISAALRCRACTRC